MTDRVYLSVGEREKVRTLLAEGLRTRADQWVAGRLALARSLQGAAAPDPAVHPRLPEQTGGVTLHPQQLLGEGGEPESDHSDVVRALLSVYEGRDLFADEEAYNAALARHVRRGLADLCAEWRPGSDFAQYLLNEVFFDRSPSAGATPGAAGDDALGERVARTLGQLGVGASVSQSVQGPRLTRLTISLRSIEDAERLRRGLGKLAFALSLEAEQLSLSRAPGDQDVHLSVPRPSATWRTVTWNEVRGSLEGRAEAAMQLPICLGTDTMGGPLTFDLADAPHLFVGGTTGSGKSMCLHALLLSLLEGGRRPSLLLVDPKAVEFAAYVNSPLLRGRRPVIEADDAFTALDGLVAEMDRRQAILQRLEARDLVEANAAGAGLARIVAVVDELGDLLMTRRDIEVPLIRLAQKARFTGIHLVLATQRPEAATFPGALRSNVPSRIALTVQKASESRIILDDAGAEALLMKGDMLIALAGRPIVRAHGCRIEAGDIAKAVARP